MRIAIVLLTTALVASGLIAWPWLLAIITVLMAPFIATMLCAWAFMRSLRKAAGVAGRVRVRT